MITAPLLHIRALLLDFDGPVCRVFAGLSAAEVAQRLLDALPADVEIPLTLGEAADPIAILRRVGEHAPAHSERIETLLCRAELQAVETAHETAGVRTLLDTCIARGWTVAVVSNNSATAVRKYLGRRDLHRVVRHVAARTSANVRALKPSPDLVVDALTALAVRPDEAMFIGDSETDIAAGRSAGVVTVGYANKPGKRRRLVDAGADLVVQEHREITDMLASFR